MPDNTIDWGQGSANNDIGWGKGPINNDLSWGMIGEDSYGHDETNLMGGGASFINTFGQPALGLSLRDLTGTDPNVVRVRRDSDDAEADFKASEVSDGTLLNWVNEAQTLFDENFASSTGWTLRSGITISGGNLNLLNVTNSAEAAYKSFGSIPFQKVLITITVTDYVQGAIYVTNLGGGGDTSPNIIANGTYTYEITLGDGNTNWGIGTSSGPTTLKVSNLKVEKISANGLVRTWYGQGNTLNAAQATAIAQPANVTSGAIETLNNLPAISYIDDNFSVFSNTSSLTGEFLITFVGSMSPDGTVNVFLNALVSANRFRVNLDGGLGVIEIRINGVTVSSFGDFPLDTQMIFQLERDSNNLISFYINGVLQGNATQEGDWVDILTYLGSNQDQTPTQFLQMKSQALVIYNSAADREGIANYLNGIYTIY